MQQGASGMAAGEIAAGWGVTPATLSFHLKELAHAGLVKARHDGRFIYYSADFEAMNELLAFLTENCCGGDPVACAPRTAARRATKDRSKQPICKQRIHSTMNVLFLCTGNSCRSILAEATFNHLAPAGWRAMSAGSQPTGQVHPRSLALLAREGIPDRRVSRASRGTPCR
ncbi:MAG: helix-turn-helix domain-containing protein [Desulfosudis oleivorans]|nr:helix-turn-helix domain-containing protein [Desulfosudis oleivorans]